MCHLNNKLKEVKLWLKLKSTTVLQSNSKGNAILYFDNTLLLDIGVPYKMIEPYVNDIKYVFISHIHTDHFNKSAVKKLANKSL